MLNHEKNNEDLMLIYNLAAMKNFKIKIYTQDKSREKQKSSVKTILITFKLALKGSISKSDSKRG